ncbi:amino ABC transporter, permease, 3-TM region, His/Glu/Gln/Arg/opine family domain protein [[Clostridium] bifermentans ATCC 638]|uniref:Amino ABC transporter, permease, 3-TM region, His/Glu/Gln/Arg/opine family domain protein n=1 Tax=Paraclostridium bifermentans ATCC 638 = DSM 14991 TaxID=1233171 RepID=T4VPA1_PARBF|nr:amino acid ABC transporter permease [Paraclostridium bifermentans]EQK42960.1 amino ABC transporter, permease, 3-TM region, His/Glu/Gln/Arg/opine family domain protein [[Clostridium] bifermentans ATCC 638] [Paraclostridium bifermentans ATCC 638 = DSM 14991]RIZ60201.1 amino acid ABC transporter permease [Paraclostridium bifermentans]UAG16838.1 amino acid ABC transporter permease [Paraclostridium bifermentans]
MLEGLKLVLIIFLFTLIISIPLGVLISFCRLSSLKYLKFLATTYLLVFRGTPLLLQLIFIFYGLPLIGIVFDRFTVALLAFSLNYSAYFAEIFRGGIQSVDTGQYEACLMLGLDKKLTFIKIILPQVFKTILSPISNEVITLIKDTSLVYILGLNDILRIAQINSNRTLSLIPLIEVGALYLILIFILSNIFKTLEQKLSYYN